MTFFIQLNEQGNPINHPVLEENFRQLFPAMPAAITPADVQGTGFALWEFSQQPELQRYEKMVEGPYRLGDDGRYFQTWSVEEMSAEEKVAVDEKQAASIRAQRNGRLRATDWVFNPDAPLAEEQRQKYITYRQALRDIPSQPGFPWEVQWPEQPK